MTGHPRTPLERDVGWDYISACHHGALPLSARNLDLVRQWRLAGRELGHVGPPWSELQRMLAELGGRR